MTLGVEAACRGGRRAFDTNAATHSFNKRRVFLQPEFDPEALQAVSQASASR